MPPRIAPGNRGGQRGGGARGGPPQRGGRGGAGAGRGGLTVGLPSVGGESRTISYDCIPITINRLVKQTCGQLA